MVLASDWKASIQGLATVGKTVVARPAAWVIGLASAFVMSRSNTIG